MRSMHSRWKLTLALVLLAPALQASPLWSEETHEIAFGDFDHDLRTDMLYIAKDAWHSSGVLLSTAAEGTLGKPSQTWPSNYLGIPWHGGTYKPIIADFNGDERDDILLQRQSPGDHYLLFANAQGQFNSISQTIPNNTGGQLWSADVHRIVAGDFNGDGRSDLFLQSVSASGLHAVYLADYSTGTFSSSQQTWSDGKFGFGWSLSKANVYAGDFTGDQKDDLFVQAKPQTVIIDFDIPFPVPAYRPDSFGIMQGKQLYQGDIFYMPVFDSWDRMERGGDWSGANYRAVIADFNGDTKADIFLQGKSSAYPNRLMLAGSGGQIGTTDALLDSTVRAYSWQQGRVHAANFDGSGGVGIYLQSATVSGTNSYANVATSSTVALINHATPPASTPAAQTYQAFTTVTRYNVGGHVTGTIAPDPDGPSGPLQFAAVRNTYDSAGRLIRVETGELSSWFNETVEPKNWSGFTVFSTQEIAQDEYGRMTKKVAKGSDGVAFAAVQMNYNSIGQLLCRAVRMNPDAYSSMPADACQLGAEGGDGPDRIIRTTFNIDNQLLTEQRGVGTSLEQTYVTNTYAGRLLQTQTDANGNKTQLAYDNYARLWKRFYPSPTSTGEYNSSDYNEYTYDENGNLKTDRKRSGAQITFSYDALNRPTDKDLSDNTHSQDVVMDYDLRGLVVKSAFSNLSGPGVSNGYDAFGRPASATSTVGGFTRTIGYQYDLNGNRTRITHPGGTYFDYEFDGLNRVKRVAENTSTELVTIKYRPNGRREKLERAGGAITNYTLDNSLRPLTFNHDFSGTTNDLTNTFTYNALSQITQLVQSNSQYSYSGAQDRVGAYVPNGRNQYTSINGQSASYDANANLTNDGTPGKTYAFDMENRLVTATGPNATLNYDPNGRLYEYVTNGTTTQFLYDGATLIGEYQVSGGSATQIKRYVHGVGADELWVQYDLSSGNTRRYVHTDHQGSVIAYSDSTGSVTASNAYDSYGIPRANNTGRFGYSGQAWLSEIGLAHHRARMYSPTLGRFLQTDPIYYKDDMNLYAYVRNDPMNKIDPSGLACVDGASQIECKVDNIVDKKGNVTPLTDAVRADLKAAGQGFWGGIAKFFGAGKAGLGAKIDKVEASMTTAMNAARAVGNNSVTIKGSGNVPDTQVTGNEIVNSVLGRTINAKNFDKPDTVGIVYAHATPTGEIEWFRPGLNAWRNDHSQMVSMLHESMHFATKAWPLSLEPDQQVHRPYFNHAAEDILKMGL